MATDQEREDMLRGKRKRLKRELRREIATLRRKLLWVETSLRERAGLTLDDDAVQGFGEDVEAAAAALETRLYDLAAVRAELGLPG